MNNRSLYLLLLSAILAVVACDDEDDDTQYPSIVTQFADVHADKDGALYEFVTDQDQTYRMTNPQEGYHPGSTYRAVCSYVPQSEGQATVYQMTGAYYLRDSTRIAQHDPINVLSVWRAGRYINMQLSPKTQGGDQYWGYCTDSIRSGWAYVSLYHRQNGDPTSYSETTYASLLVDSIPGISGCDSICFRIHTFDGLRSWKLPY